MGKASRKKRSVFVAGLDGEVRAYIRDKEASCRLGGITEATYTVQIQNWGSAKKTKPIMGQIAACAKKGLREMIAVVGNVEDMSEVTFVPTPVDLRCISPAEKSAVAQVAKVQRYISAFWNKPQANGRPSTGLPEPFIQVEKVQHIASAPLPRFLRLPPSIHRFTWVQTCSSLESFALKDLVGGRHGGPEDNDFRLLPLRSVCRMSREVAL